MKISREIIINGQSQTVEYELTGIELERCFNECQSAHDKAEIRRRLEDLKYRNVPDDIVDDLASQFRTTIDDTLDDFVIHTVQNNNVKLEKYGYKVFSVEVTRTIKHTYTIRARDEDDAERIYNEWADHHEDEIAYDMGNEYSEDETGWFEEKPDMNPDYADITEEEGE